MQKCAAVKLRGCADHVPYCHQEDERSQWPSTRVLLLLKLWVTLYPVSDRRHPVITPAAILVSAHLALCRLTSASDIARGLAAAALQQTMFTPLSGRHSAYQLASHQQKCCYTFMHNYSSGASAEVEDASLEKCSQASVSAHGFASHCKYGKTAQYVCVFCSHDMTFSST